MNFADLAHLHDPWITAGGYELEHDFPEAEYRARVARARAWMAEADLDALVITSSVVGRWFTSLHEPHEWHDLCQARSAWYVLSHDHDVLFMSPTAAGEHFNTTRRSTWVDEIRGIVERAEAPTRVEIWALEQMPGFLGELGLAYGRLGFELGDCMTLGLSVADFLRLRELMPDAALVDGSTVIRRLMSVLTPWEVEQLRAACVAADWIHAQVAELLHPGMTERAFFASLEERFRARYDEPYTYTATGVWDVRNAADPSTSNLFHAVVTDRPYRPGDVVMRGYSGVGFRGYIADTDRVWAIGAPTSTVRDLYALTWECNRVMAETIRPGVRCADVYEAGARVEATHGRAPRLTGRTGHGLRNTGAISVHPDCQTVLEPGMVISVEPMFPTVHGFFDLEDQYLVTEQGAECLHDPAPAELPVVGV
jgi:Xaa-Pro aminopeptidase